MTDTKSASAGSSTDASLGELVSRMSEQTSRLIRDELRLAQAEMSAKGKKAGIGAGLFGGAGLIGLFGIGCFVTAAILGLANVVDAWLAALIIGAALVVIAGIAALIGKREIGQATPPIPQESVHGLKLDVQTLKPGAHR
jgi:hypothetical protein